MKNKFRKEFTISTDPDIENLYFGALPSEGRYFTKKCERLSDGIFRVEVEVPKGDLYYHFKIQDEWQEVLLDPNNFQIGAKNWHSICRIGTTSFNHVEFDMEDSYISMISERQVEIKIIAHQQWIEQINLLIFRSDDEYEEIEGECICNIQENKYFKTIIDIDKIAGHKFCFMVICKDNKFYFDQSLQLVNQVNNYFVFDPEKICYNSANYVGPVYHIFPDSFAVVDINKVEGREIISHTDLPKANAFYGGNLKGIISKLDYIERLGIKCIYLTPIFYANSNDRYACIDFKKIDPMLGTEEDFRNLCEEAHRRDIKVVLDIVLNHCGTDFWMFHDILEKQENSKYCDYYDIYEYPVRYEQFWPKYSSWWGNGDMPQFNLRNKKVTDYLFECCKYWLDKYEIDGWRIDVSSELEHDLLKEFRSKMKDGREDIILIGENWKDAREFLHGDELDGVTNYLSWWRAFEPFFCTKTIDILQFANYLMSSYFIYAHNRSISNWNVLSSHDVPRFFSKIADQGDAINAVATQIFIPGSPVIYYGDEVRLQGGDTPDNRRPMPWATLDENAELHRVYRFLLRTRNMIPALQYGDFKIPYVNGEDKILILERSYKNEKIYCILNFSDITQSVEVQSILSQSGLRDLVSEQIIDREIQVLQRNFALLQTNME